MNWRHDRSLRRWLVKGSLGSLISIQLLVSLLVYALAQRYLLQASQAQQRQVIEEFWRHRPPVMGGDDPRPRLSLLRDSQWLQDTFPEFKLQGQRPPFSLWGPLFADIASALSRSQGAVLYEAQGRVLYRWGQSGPGLTGAEVAWVLQQQASQQAVVRLEQERFLELRFPMGQWGVLYLLKSAAPLGEQLGHLAAIFLLGNALALMGGFVLLRAVANSILQPLEPLLAATVRLGNGDLSARSGLPASEHEISALGHAFDGMAAKLEDQFRLQRRFVSDASHELKTPLTSMSGALEMLERGEPKALPLLRSQLGRMERLVRDLLTLSAAQDGSRERRQLLDLRDLVEELLDEASMVAGRHCQLQSQLPEPLPLWGQEDPLRRLLGNLLDNAIQASPPGGLIQVGGLAQPEHLRIWIQDHGTGVDPQDLPFLCQRFYRSDLSRARPAGATGGGTGLGLAIVAALVESYSGHLQIESTLGQGTRVTVVLPRTEGKGRGSKGIATE